MFGQFSKRKSFKVHRGGAVSHFKKNVDDISTEMENDGVTTSTELTKKGRELFGSKYKGTYSQDTVPRFSEDAYFIFNTDVQNKPGVHWLGGVYDKAKHKYIIFDSFGRNISRLVPFFVKQHNADSEIVDNDHHVRQSKNGDDCGERSLAWLKLVDEHGINFARKL
jgi:hypothetical protein